MTEPALQSTGALLLTALKADNCADKSRIVDDLLARSELAYTDNPRIDSLPLPGIPAAVKLVEPKQVGRRSLGTEAGRACFLHAIAHIEFNAINLALDAVYRFPGMPETYVRDWLGVAADEARHHRMLADRMADLGYVYGDFTAHNGLWEIATRTGHDPVTRMAMVPCVMEARGLDVTPGMIRRLRGVGDESSADLLEQILQEEESHVAIGVKWYRRLCGESGMDPVSHYFTLLRAYLPGRVQGPFNHASRRAAGFDDHWLAGLESRELTGGGD